MIGVYKITSPTNKIYIGQSTNIEKRKKSYSKLKCKDQTKLYSSLIKYGWENHIFEIIEQCDESQLLIRETYWKNYYNVLEIPSLCCRLDGKGGRMGMDSKKKLSSKIKDYWDNISEDEYKKRVEKSRDAQNRPEVKEKQKLKKGIEKPQWVKDKLKVSQNKESTVKKRKESLRKYWDSMSLEERERLRKLNSETQLRPDVREKLSKNNGSHRLEVREKQRKAALNRKKEECPHCGKVMDIVNAKKYHFFNCKHKS